MRVRFRPHFRRPPDVRVGGSDAGAPECTWPTWLRLRYGWEPSPVSLYRHKQHGLVYAVEHSWTGPSSYDVKHTCVAQDWYSAETKDQLKQTRRYTDIHDPSKEVRSEQWTAKDRADDARWWSEVELVHGRCRAPPMCKRPAFFTAAWIREAMGLGKLSPKQIRDDFTVNQYRHATLGDVYAITWSGIADAPTPFFNSRGERIYSAYTPGWDRPSQAQKLQQKQWNDSLIYIGKCT